jgi:hypothetical protein
MRFIRLSLTLVISLALVTSSGCVSSRVYALLRITNAPTEVSLALVREKLPSELQQAFPMTRQPVASLIAASDLWHLVGKEGTRYDGIHVFALYYEAGLSIVIDASASRGVRAQVTEIRMKVERLLAINGLDFVPKATHNSPNKSLQPTATAVMPPAAQEIMPAVAVAEH